MPYASASHGFRQNPPTLANQYADDPVLQGILSNYLPSDILSKIEQDLYHLGDRSIGDIQKLGDNAESHPPKLTQYDHWCRRIDEIETAEGWRVLKDISAAEGLIAIAYEREYAEYSRIYQFAKLYISTPAMAMFGCPLAMTDGAARLIELCGTEEMKGRALKNLTSRDPANFWTSGQWMTERPGGSDVGGTETEAVPLSGNEYHISGFKWFSSATDADMTFLVARTQDQNGSTKPGSKGLSLFYAELRDADGMLKGIKVHRLKNKMGTKALPTAELELDKLPAQMVGPPYRGVATIAVILNITRIHSALSTTGALGRSLAIAKSYAQKRQVFGKLLANQPLHLRTLADISLTHRACLHLLFYAVKLLGESEVSPSSSQRIESTSMLRLTTPLLKMWVCHEAMPSILEAMEACGGQGYMEETGIARQLRDAQVNAIWEGTTNVQALDLLRIVSTSFPLYQRKINEMLETAVQIPEIQSTASVAQKSIRNALSSIEHHIKQPSKENQELRARNLGFAMARTLVAALFISHAGVLIRRGHRDAEASLVAAQMWDLKTEELIGEGWVNGGKDRVLVFGGARL